MPKFKKALVLISLCCPAILFAGTTPSIIPFKEGEQFQLSLSSINFNRVFVEGEVITKLSYPSHAITVDKSELGNSEIGDGSVYLKPNFDVPITVFITTDKGHHLSLTLSPDESSGKTLQLVSRNQTSVKYVKSEARDVSDVEEAMAAMKQGETPKDFKIKQVMPRSFYIKDIKVTLEKQYQGARLTGYVYRLLNKSKHEINLTTNMFAHRDAESLYLSNEQLKPQKIAYLYGLYGNQG